MRKRLKKQGVTPATIVTDKLGSYTTAYITGKEGPFSPYGDEFEPRRLPPNRMIPSTTGSAAVPVTTGNLLFHVIVDDFNRTFSMDGPGGPNGIRLHYEMMRVARTQAKILRDFDVRAESREAALAQMKAQFPDYIFLGSWAAAQAK